MSEARSVDTERSDEEKLKSLIRRDLDPEITAVAKKALELHQEDSS